MTTPATATVSTSATTRTTKSVGLENVTYVPAGKATSVGRYTVEPHQPTRRDRAK